ncbi:IDEAL domain-containing protein [Metabacillus sp. Hm71]|uniref:IDEAL domain-containing protein n=1 Tax=Metabacillus sp. Hm71 TaxID=3450743 RepID=UPI003F4417C9
MYREGDWVFDKYKCLGYITNVHENEISGRFIRSSAGYKMNRTSILKFEDIDPAEIEHQEADLMDMINLALQYDDEDWFLSLTDRLRVLEKGEA